MELEYRTFSERLHATALRERIPLVGSMAATYRCNLDCKHCYLSGCRGANELSCEQWQGLIDQIVEAGCLWFVISGGEPLVRLDFERIYRYARGKGLLVGVFTNGTLIDDRVIELWRESPPYVVEVSLYGYSRTTYAAVTGAPEARDAAFEGVRRLARAGIPTRLKSMVLRQNADEIELLSSFSNELGLQFRSDSMVSPGLDGSREPCATRLDPSAIMQLEAADEQTQRGWQQFLGCSGSLAPRHSLFACSGGAKFFFIDPSGLLALCPFDRPVYDLVQGSFLDGWNGPIEQRRSAKLPADHACFGCREMAFCGICPPIARMETGSDAGVPEALCELGKQRSHTLRTQLVTAAAPRRSSSRRVV